MKIFKGFNEKGKACPVCDTKENKPCTLVPIIGTQEGNNMQAMAIHVDCYPTGNYMNFDGRKMIIATIARKDKI